MDRINEDAIVAIEAFQEGRLPMRQPAIATARHRPTAHDRLA